MQSLNFCSGCLLPASPAVMDSLFGTLKQNKLFYYLLLDITFYYRNTTQPTHSFILNFTSFSFLKKKTQRPHPGRKLTLPLPEDINCPRYKPLPEWWLMGPEQQPQSLWVPECCGSVLPRRRYLTPFLSHLDLLQFSTPSSMQVPESSGGWRRLWHRCHVCAWALHRWLSPTPWLVVSYCLNYRSFHKETSLMRFESWMNLWVQRSEFREPFGTMSNRNRSFIADVCQSSSLAWILGQIYSTSHSFLPTARV